MSDTRVYLHLTYNAAYCSHQCAEDSQLDDNFILLTPEQLQQRWHAEHPAHICCSMCQKPIVLVPETV